MTTLEIFYIFKITGAISLIILSALVCFGFAFNYFLNLKLKKQIDSLHKENALMLSKNKNLAKLLFKYSRKKLDFTDPTNKSEYRCLYCNSPIFKGKLFCNKKHQLSYQQNGFHSLTNASDENNR